MILLINNSKEGNKLSFIVELRAYVHANINTSLSVRLRRVT